MLSRQCPNCGSFNDEKAQECYFCHQDFSGGNKRKSKDSEANAGQTTRYRAGPPPHMKIGQRTRPGCITLLAMGLFLIAIYFLLSAFCTFSAMDKNFVAMIYQGILGFFYDLAARLLSPFNEVIFRWVGENVMLLVATLFSIAGILLFIGWGLWNTTRWARILFMILMGATAVGSLLYFIPGLINTGISIPDYLRVLPEPILTLLPPVTILFVIGVSVFPFLWFAQNGKYFKH
jgi:hypothetical protein